MGNSYVQSYFGEVERSGPIPIKATQFKDVLLYYRDGGCDILARATTPLVKFLKMLELMSTHGGEKILLDPDSVEEVPLSEEIVEGSGSEDEDPVSISVIIPENPEEGIRSRRQSGKDTTVEIDPMMEQEEQDFSSGYMMISDPIYVNLFRVHMALKEADGSVLKRIKDIHEGKDSHILKTTETEKMYEWCEKNFTSTLRYSAVSQSIVDDTEALCKAIASQRQAGSSKAPLPNMEMSPNTSTSIETSVVLNSEIFSMVSELQKSLTELRSIQHEFIDTWKSNLSTAKTISPEQNSL